MKEGTSSAKGFMILSFAGIFAKILAVFNTPLLNRIIGVQGMGIMMYLCLFMLLQVWGANQLLQKL